MDKHNIQQDINNILQEEIPDDMNILPEIHERLQRQANSSHQPFMTFSKIAAVIAIFVIVSAGGYALIQYSLVSNSIPEQIITDISETQIIEGVEVTLNWAYADAHRIALAYSMEYLPTDTFINAPVITLTTADGIEIPSAFGGGGGGGGAPNQPTISEMLLNYDASVIKGNPDGVDLVLTLDFSVEAVMSNPSMAHMTSGGGGGGGSEPVPTPDVSNIIDRIYTFNFTLPFYEALEVEPIQETVTSNDISMTVNHVRYTPSLTKFDICYNMPDDELWNAQVQVVTDSPNSPFYASRIEPILPSTDDESPCYEYSVSAAISGEEETITIRALYLSQPIRPFTEEAVRAEEAYFAEQGYIIKIDADPNGYSLDVLDYPDDMDELDAEAYVRANLFYKRYQGDWSFEVPLR